MYGKIMQTTDKRNLGRIIQMDELPVVGEQYRFNFLSKSDTLIDDMVCIRLDGDKCTFQNSNYTMVVSIKY